MCFGQSLTVPCRAAGNEDGCHPTLTVSARKHSSTKPWQALERFMRTRTPEPA